MYSEILEHFLTLCMSLDDNLTFSLASPARGLGQWPPGGGGCVEVQPLGQRPPQPRGGGGRVPVGQPRP